MILQWWFVSKGGQCNNSVYLIKQIFETIHHLARVSGLPWPGNIDSWQCNGHFSKICWLHFVTVNSVWSVFGHLNRVPDAISVPMLEIAPGIRVVRLKMSSRPYKQKFTSESGRWLASLVRVKVINVKVTFRSLHYCKEFGLLHWNHRSWTSIQLSVGLMLRQDNFNAFEPPFEPIVLFTASDIWNSGVCLNKMAQIRHNVKCTKYWD